jgi:hypothetical protein
MEAVTQFKLPWRLLREKLAVANESNEIIYANTLQMIESDDIVSSTSSAAHKPLFLTIVDFPLSRSFCSVFAT